MTRDAATRTPARAKGIRARRPLGCRERLFAPHETAKPPEEAGGFGSVMHFVRGLTRWLGRASPIRRAPCGASSQCEQACALPAESAVRKLLPQPQAATAFGLFTVNPAPISVSI